MKGYGSTIYVVLAQVSDNFKRCKGCGGRSKWEKRRKKAVEGLEPKSEPEIDCGFSKI